MGTARKTKKTEPKANQLTPEQARQNRISELERNVFSVGDAEWNRQTVSERKKWMDELLELYGETPPEVSEYATMDELMSTYMEKFMYAFMKIQNESM